METDQLIRTLAADSSRPARPVSLVLALALLAAMPVSLAMLFAGLGVRPDVMRAMHNPFFDLKFAVTLALAISAVGVALHLSRPEASLRGWAWLLLIPAGLLVGGITSEMMLPQNLPMMTRLIGSNSRVCLTAVPLMSMPLLAAALIGLRHGAPTRPAVSGAIAGLLSAGLAATLYASHCTDDSPLFVATWYTIATALVAAIGAAIGARVLRF
ncbi:MAG: DUF1109 family protein [Alphaproteobacteria bacterium]|jgi:hypothetical protein|nr:MAG: DUF1109 family protein [Alphaproteobacteria bacterium]